MEDLEPELQGYQWGDDIPVVITSENGPEAILRIAEEKINARGWDQKPMVCIVNGNEGIASVDEVPIPDEVLASFGKGFMAFVMALSEIVWEQRNGEYPPYIQSLRDDVLSMSFYGVLVSTEGWTVPEPDSIKEPDKWAEYAAAAMGGGFHEHPDRVEVRNTILYSAKKECMTIFRMRGKDPVYSGGPQSVDPRGSVIRATEAFTGLLIALLLHRGLSNQEILDAWKGDTNE